MTDPACSSSLLEWAGWITAMVTAVTGFAVTTYGWRVRGAQTKRLARQKDIHDSINEVVKAISEFEDATYAFWLDSSSNIQPHQLLLLHNRIQIKLQQLAHLKAFAMPTSELIELKKQATMDAESKEEQPSNQSRRLRKLSREVTKILKSDALTKSWDL